MKSPYSLGVICILFLSIVFIRLSDKNLGKDGKYGVLTWDNFGYYLYLPATFIFDDLKIEDLDWVNDVRKKYNPSSSFYQAYFIEGGTHVIQYTMGMAVIYLPAFWAGHLYALGSDDYSADGFSAPYQLAILFYSLLLVALGLYFLRKLGLVYFSDKIIAFTIVILCFGSNYFQLASTNTSSPHSILFTFYAILLYQVYKWHLNPTFKRSILFSILFGIMVLARPNELIFCLIPLFWGVTSLETLKTKFKFFLKNYQYLLLIFGFMAAIGLMQVAYWKLTSNQWFFDSYTNEGFKFLSPYLKEYLFSYKKGWLVYSPVFLFLIYGYYQLYKRSREIAIPLSLHFIITIWILSSWDNWWYADSFSQRSIVQCYPVFIFPFAAGLELVSNQKKIVKYSFFGFFIAVTILNIFQTYQVKKGMLHTQRMTKDYYWKVFGKTTVEPSVRRLLEPERKVNYLPQELSYSKKLLFSTNSLKLTPENPYSKKLAFGANQISKNGNLYLKVKVGYQVNKVENGKFGVVFQTLDHRSNKYYSFIYETQPIREFPGYQTLSAVYAPPFLRSMSDSIEVYLWLFDNASIEIDQFTIECFDPRKTESKKSAFSIETTGAFIDSKGSLGFYQIDSLHPFSPALDKVASLVDFKSGKYQISVEGLNDVDTSEVYAVVSLSKGEGNIYYQAFRIQNGGNAWNTWTFDGEILSSIPNKSSLKFYLWNKSKDPFYYKGLSLDFKD